MSVVLHNVRSTRRCTSQYTTLMRTHQRACRVPPRHLSTTPIRSSPTTNTSGKPASAYPPFNSADAARPYTPATLKGSCTCGSVGFTATGKSVSNFICHCSLCRAATQKPYTVATTFLPDQVKFRNDTYIDRRSMQNSVNKRLYCKQCNGYVAEDATATLGTYALSLAACGIENSEIAPEYKPNFHIYYNDKVRPINDNMPKWSGMLDSSAVEQNNIQRQSYSDNTMLNSTYDVNTGVYKRDVQPYSSVKSPEPLKYNFSEFDVPINNVTVVSPEQIKDRVRRKYIQSSQSQLRVPDKRQYDAIIIGGGHNGLTTAAYLAKAGLSVCVLERRSVIGGAAITEELHPGFKFSRFSYLAGLFRPQIIEELELKKYGFEYLPRTPSSFTPTRTGSAYNNKFLLLGQANSDDDLKSIAQFSQRDAEMYPKYEQLLNNMRDVLQHLLDEPLPSAGNRRDMMRSLKQIRKIMRTAYQHRKSLASMYELFTGSATQILDRYFESDILKTTLATDAVIGSMASPRHAGSAYVLLHHVMGESAGRKGVWSYAKGGMGAISNSIAQSARAHGATIVTDATVDHITYTHSGSAGQSRATGVQLIDGTQLTSNIVLSNATPYHTFLELLPGFAKSTGYIGETESPLPDDFVRHIRFTDYSSGVAKINCAVSELPNFTCYPTSPDGSVGPQHCGTIHFESRMDEIENAQREASAGLVATQPVIEMTIPSSVDKTISPPGQHVVQLFIQYCPYTVDPKQGSWHDDKFKQQFADRIFRVIDQFAPNFSKSVLYRDILTPVDIERITGLQQGNIFQGALSLSQLAYNRPAPNYSDHRTPISGLYMCGAGAHPGGGVMGACGKNAASVVLSDLGKSI